MGEGFRADVADCCDVCVGRREERFWQCHGSGLGVDLVNYELDFFFWCLALQESEDLTAFRCEWRVLGSLVM